SSASTWARLCRVILRTQRQKCRERVGGEHSARAAERLILFCHLAWRVLVALLLRVTGPVRVREHDVDAGLVDQIGRFLGALEPAVHRRHGDAQKLCQLSDAAGGLAGLVQDQRTHVGTEAGRPGAIVLGDVVRGHERHCPAISVPGRQTRASTTRTRGHARRVFSDCQYLPRSVAMTRSPQRSVPSTTASPVNGPCLSPTAPSSSNRHRTRSGHSTRAKRSRSSSQPSLRPKAIGSAWGWLSSCPPRSTNASALTWRGPPWGGVVKDRCTMPPPCKIRGGRGTPYVAVRPYSTVGWCAASTVMLAPLRSSPRSEAAKSTMSASSSGCGMRPSGRFLVARLSASSSLMPWRFASAFMPSATRPVSVRPGLRPTTRTPLPA